MRITKRVLIITVLPFFLGVSSEITCFAQTSATGQIQRSQEVLQNDKTLRNRIEEEEKVFIKNILVEGANSISEDRIKEITRPFQKRWLTKKDILQVLDSIKQAYLQEGYAGQPADISYAVKGKVLKIRVEEVNERKI